MFRNLKNGKLYHYLGEVINCTNAQDGQIMVLYENEEGMKFVREKEEFHVKFEKVAPFQIKMENL